MTAVRVKICGLRSAGDALAAARAGADIIGVVFTESPRRVTVETAREIAAALGARPETGHRDAAATGAARFEAMLARRRPLLAGVFGEEAAGDIAATAAAAGLDVIQLSGREPGTQAKALAAHDLIVVARPSAAAGLEGVPAGALALLDAPHASMLGGTGHRLDAAVAARCAAERAVLLAGGLTPENVAATIAAVRPWGVDVSSGVETNGAKDHAKIRDFIAAARSVEVSA